MVLTPYMVYPAKHLAKVHLTKHSSICYDFIIFSQRLKPPVVKVLLVTQGQNTLQWPYLVWWHIVT